MRFSSWLAVLTVSVVPPIVHADPPRDPPDTVTASPIGAAFRAFAVEYERAVAPRATVFVEGVWLAGIELPDTMSHAATGAGVRIGARWFPWQRAQRGVFVGFELHGTLGTVAAPDGDYRARAIGVAPQVGYSLVVWQRLALSAGIGLELNASNLEDDAGDRTLHLRAAPLPRANVGVAF